MVTNGEPKEATKEYIDYVTGKDFEKQVEDMGYIPMTKLKRIKFYRADCKASLIHLNV